MKRINVFAQEKYPKDGKAIVFGSETNLQALKQQIIDKLYNQDMLNDNCIKLYTINGGEIDCVDSIFMDDIIIAQYKEENAPNTIGSVSNSFSMMSLQNSSESVPLVVRQHLSGDQLKHHLSKTNNLGTAKVFCKVMETRAITSNTKSLIVELYQEGKNDSFSNENQKSLLLKRLDSVIQNQVLSNVCETSDKDNVIYGDVLYIFNGKELSLNDAIPEDCKLESFEGSKSSAESVHITNWLGNNSEEGIQSKKALFVIIRPVSVVLKVVTPSGRCIELKGVQSNSSIGEVKGRVRMMCDYQPTDQMYFYTNDKDLKYEISNQTKIFELNNFRGRDVEVILNMKLNMNLFN